MWYGKVIQESSGPLTAGDVDECGTVFSPH